ncbi:MAG: class I SAM-dependent methyltransferase [Halioglobus sp.]
MTHPADPLSQQLRELPAFRALLRGIECRLFNAAGPLPQPQLDLGCGDGHFAQLAYQRPPTVGIDVDTVRLLEARHRGSHRLLLRAQAQSLPLPDASMASVTANCVLEHILPLELTLSEVLRVLQPGARFLFGVPSHRFADMLLGATLLRKVRLRRWAEAYGRWFNRHSEHHHVYSPDEWVTRLEEHGFTVEHWEYYMTAAGLRAFDLCHYLGLPRLLSYRLTGRWVIRPIGPVNRLYDAWLRPHFEAAAPDAGAYIFFHARKPNA